MEETKASNPLDVLSSGRTFRRPLSVNAAVNRRTLAAAGILAGGEDVAKPTAASPPPFDGWAGVSAVAGAGSSAAGEDVLISEPAAWGDIEFEHVGSKRVKLVKGGTLQQLVTWLAYYVCTSEQVEDVPGMSFTADEDIHYASIFFLSLANLGTVEEFIMALHHMYERQVAAQNVADRQSAPVQVAGVLTHWLNGHVDDLPPRMHSEAFDLADWLLGVVAADSGAALTTADGKPSGLCARVPVVQEALDEASAALASGMKKHLVAAVPEPLASRATDTKMYTSFWDATVKDIAEQLTYLDWRLFVAVPTSEFMENGWDRPRYEHTADNIRCLIDRLNAVSLWVQSAILDGTSPRERADIIRRFVTIARLMRSLNNFAGLWSIVTGMSIDTIQRLDQTWALVSAESVSEFEALKAVFNSSNFYQAYRDVLDATPKDSVIVPYLGAHTKELTITFDQMPDRMPGRKAMIHFKKYRSLHRIIKPLLAMQQQSHGIRVNRPLINLLNAAVNSFYFHFADDRDKVTDVLHRKSVRLEPTVPAMPAHVPYGEDGMGTIPED